MKESWGLPGLMFPGKEEPSRQPLTVAEAAMSYGPVGHAFLGAWEEEQGIGPGLLWVRDE